MNIVNVRDTWAEIELLKVQISIIKDITNGYKDSLLRRQDENF